VSNPKILNVRGIPDSVPPGDTFTIEATIKQNAGGDPWTAGAAWCTSKTLNIQGWKTPVEVWVDGEKVGEDSLCMASGKTRTATLSVSVDGEPETNHTVEVRAIKIEDFGYDLTPAKESVNDDLTRTVVIDPEAEDASEPSSLDNLLRPLRKVADALGGSVTQIALGAVAVLVVLMVI
jgi:hypothetical protein